MLKKLSLLVMSVALFMGLVFAPIQLHADGNPMCPPGRACQPIP
jgi:hypothetical protein